MKYIIVDSVKDANRYIRRSNKKNIGEILSDVHCCHLSELAKEIVVRERAAGGCLKAPETMDSVSGVILLEEIIAQKFVEDFFVPQESMSTATVQEVWRSLLQVRMGEETEQYRTSEELKVKQLQQLCRAYEQELEERDIYDECRMYREACEILQRHITWSKQGKDSYAVLDDCYEKLSALQIRFLNLISGNSYERIPVKGAESEEVEAALKDVAYFRGYGIANEIRYVLRDVEEKQLPLGEVLVLYTSAEYEMYLEALFGSWKIPYCMTNRQTVTDNRYLGLMKQILRWAEEGYAYEKLKAVVTCPGVSYVTKSEDGEEKYQSYIYPFYRGIKHEPKGAFKDWLEELRGVFQKGADGAFSYADTYLRLVDFARKTIGNHQDYAYISSSLYKEVDGLRMMGKTSDESALLRILRERIQSISFSDAEEKNAVCIEKYVGNVRVLDRKYVYLVGMSSAHVSSATTDSPVLSEEEMKVYLSAEHGFLALGTALEEHYRRNLYRTIATREDETQISIGYCGFDTVNLRKVAPSVIFLRLMDMTGVSEKDVMQAKYTDVLTDSVKVEEKAIWGEEIAKEKEAKKEMQERTWSASSLQTLLGCPLKYYYQNICEIPEEDYQQQDPESWLSAADRGTLAHNIFERYCNLWFKGKKSNEVASCLQVDSFRQIVEEETKKMVEQCPYTSYGIYEIEVAELMEKCRLYLEQMHKQFSDKNNLWSVHSCEADFNDFCMYYNKDGVCQEGDEGAVKLCFKGRIDRVDSYVDSDGTLHYRIIDYKSGKSKNLEKSIKGKTTIQHILYAMAMRHEGAVVDEFCFHHFWEEDENAQVLRFHQEGLGEFPQEVHDTIRKTIPTGTFDKGEKTDCTYCTYKDICKACIGEEL